MLTTEIVRETPAGRKRVSEIDDGSQWYADLRQRMRETKKPITEITVLSPSRAAALLAANDHNRPISDRNVSIMVADILAGRWQFNGEPIIISETGELNDGQHRCHAVTLAGKAIEVLLVAGVSRKSRYTVDMGTARTVGNFLGMHGIADANNVAAIAAIMHAFEHDAVRKNTSSANEPRVHKSNNTPTKAEIRTYAEANLDDIKRAMEAFPWSEAKKLTTLSRVCGIAVVISRSCKEWGSVEAFISKLIDGSNLSKTNPIFVARERIIAERNDKTLTAFRFFEIVIRAWNAHRSGQQSKIIKVLGVLPEIAR